MLSVLGLKCLVKQREALRGRNLSRDSQASGAPRVHRTSDVQVASEVVFLTSLGHPNHASENPPSNVDRTLGSRVGVTSSGYRHYQVVALDCRGGIVFPVLRRGSGATRRVNSSLRSHRTRRSQCRRVSSGLNKTLFASVGPNLPCRGRQLRCPATPGRFSTGEKPRCQLGRIKPSRGLRLDGMSRVQSLALARGIQRIPPHVVVRSMGSGRLLSRLAIFPDSLGRTGLVGGGVPMARRSGLVRLAISNHSIQKAEQPSAHRHVGFAWDAAGPADQALPDGLLLGVGLAQRHGGVAQRPTQGARAGLGDGARLGAAGRFLNLCRGRLSTVGSDILCLGGEGCAFCARVEVPGETAGGSAGTQPL